MPPQKAIKLKIDKVTKKDKPFKLGPNQRKWLKALRSGWYKQGKGNLAKTKGKSVRYCCLGVLCEVAGMKRKPAFHDPANVFAYSDHAERCPPKAIRFAALRNSEGQAFDNWEEPSCIEMNDERTWNFKKIADYLEEHAAEYFERSR